jgi:hypothetical protein
MGAAGDTRMGAVRTEAVVGRIAPAEGERISVAGGRAVAEGTSALEEVAADSEAGGRRVRRRWRGRAELAVEHLEGALTGAGRRVLRAGIRRARTVEEATGDRVTPLAATAGAMAAMAGQATRHLAAETLG